MPFFRVCGKFLRSFASRGKVDRIVKAKHHEILGTCLLTLSPLGYIALSIGVGLTFGVLLQKARFCFVSVFRDFVIFKDTRVLKGVLAGIAVMTLFWSLQATLGYFRGFWTPPWGLVSLFGRFVFGIGMTMAGGCASGTLYRAGPRSIVAFETVRIPSRTQSCDQVCNDFQTLR